MDSLISAAARRIWLRAQRLETRTPFGEGPAASLAAIKHLGYVQIDTINVIERSHHHILFSRVPAYRRDDLKLLQSTDKSVFEYWTHALSYIATEDLPFFLGAMAAHKAAPGTWFASVAPDAVPKLLRQIRRDGPVSIRDIDDEPVEKTHLWASRKPSKRALELAFYNGQLAIATRDGMVKSYELMERHFGWARRPRAAGARQLAQYRLERALRSQGFISGSSLMYPRATIPEDISALMKAMMLRKQLVEVRVAESREPHWITPEALEERVEIDPALVHILSPFDPMIIQRKRVKAVFGYDHVFEAYVPKDKRRFGYFTLPVLVGDRMAAAIDLKTDRRAGRLLVQAWHWLDEGRKREDKPLIEAGLDRFARFQLAGED